MHQLVYMNSQISIIQINRKKEKQCTSGLIRTNAFTNFYPNVQVDGVDNYFYQILFTIKFNR